MIDIPVSTLKAASMIAARKASRQYLNGVQIVETIDATHVRSTDGLHMAYDDIILPNPDTNGAQVDLVIPIHTVLLAIKTKAKTVKLMRSDATGWWVLDVHMFKPVDGCYPDLNCVFPKRLSTSDLHSDLYYRDQLALAESAMRTSIGNPKAAFRLQHETDKCLMYRDNFEYPKCVVMQLNPKLAYRDN